MSLEFPTKEQMLYSELAIVDALACCIRDNAAMGAFDDEDLEYHLTNACHSIRGAYFRMKYLINKSKEECRECF